MKLSAVILVVGCNLASMPAAFSSGPIKKELINSNNTDEMYSLSEQLYKSKKDSIPIFLEVLSKSLENQYVTNNYARVNICIEYLHRLAVNGLYDKSEIPILLLALRKQIYVKDTLPTAEIVKIITGVDVGYNKEFIDAYTTDDEPKDRR